jgi:hypothetical protein
VESSDGKLHGYVGLQPSMNMRDEFEALRREHSTLIECRRSNEHTQPGLAGPPYLIQAKHDCSDTEVDPTSVNVHEQLSRNDSGKTAGVVRRHGD